MSDLKQQETTQPVTAHPLTEHVDVARREAIAQIERRRRFWTRDTIVTLIMVIVTVSWAITQYHSASGWPTHGFTQSSWPLVPHVWNVWIIWPTMVWVLWIAVDAWWTFGRKPITEAEIQREIERQKGPRQGHA